MSTSSTTTSSTTASSSAASCAGRSSISRLARIVAVVAAASTATLAVPHVAGAAAAAAKADSTSFAMKAIGGVVPCMSADAKTAPTIQVRVERGDENDRLELRGRGFKPGIQFDLFTIQNSRLNSAGAPDPKFNGFGMSWYQSDLHADDRGRISTRIRTILLDQVFGLVDKGPTPVKPTNTFNVGFWFNNPADAAACGFTGSTPFNGEHAAGPLAFVTVPDAATNLGPLCTSPTNDPNGNGAGTVCNP